MKKIEIVCLVMLLSTILWSGEKNLLVNSDFKLNPGKGIPSAWQLSPHAIGDVIELPNKSRALEITGSETGKKYWWIQNLSAIKVGQSYLLSGKFKADVGTQCAVYVECNSPWKTISTGIITGNGQWQEFSKTVKFDTLNKAPYLVLRVTAPGKAQFAEMKLISIKKEFLRDIRFSEINNQGKLIHWHANIPKAGKRIVIDSKAMLQLASIDKKTVFFQQGNLPIKAGEKYEITVKFKGSIGAIFSSYVESNKPWQTIGSAKISCNGQWQEIKYFVTLKPFQNPPYFILRLQGGGEVIIKDVEMKQIGQSLCNGDFSRGSENWQLDGAKIIDSKGGRGLVLEGNCVKKNFSATQTGIVTDKGYYQLTYEVRGGSDRTYRDSQGAVWFRVYPIQNGKTIPGTDVWLDSFDSWQKKTVNFVSQSGDISIKCEVKAPGCVWFDNISLTPLKSHLPPLELALDGSVAYRFGVYSTNRHEKLFSGAVWDNNWENGTTLKLTFNGKEYPLTEGEKGNYIFKLPVPTKVGAYPIVVERLDKNNKVTASITEKFQVNPPATREVTFRSDKVMLIDGKPFFPLGVWTVKGKLSPEEITKRIADAGFNIGLCVDPMLMDTYAANGMLCQLKIPEALPKFKNKDHFMRWDKMYRKEMQQYIKHPALVSYFIADEPAWGGYKVSPIIESYKYIRSLDPYRPVLLNEAPRGKIEDLRPYTAACDVYGVDIYPVPAPNPHSGLPDDKTMSSVGKYTDICHEVVRNRKPIWMTLQAFAWGILTNKPVVYPTHEENRFMAYNAITHGATGLFYWGINRKNHENWDYITLLGKTIHELRNLSSVLVSKTITPAHLTCSTPELRIMHKQCLGKNWYIVVNESNKHIKADFKLKNNKKINLFFEKRNIDQKSQSFSDEFKPYDVHVYSDSTALPPPLTQPAVKPVFGKRETFSQAYRSAKWIWYPGKNKIANHRAYFKKEFNLSSVPNSAELTVFADDHCQVMINGKVVIENYKVYSGTTCDISKLLEKGKNQIFIKAADGGKAPCGLLFGLTVTDNQGKITTWLSDSSMLTSEDNVNWVKSQILGEFGCSPWLYDHFSLSRVKKEVIGVFPFIF